MKKWFPTVVTLSLLTAAASLPALAEGSYDDIKIEVIDITDTLETEAAGGAAGAAEASAQDSGSAEASAQDSGSAEASAQDSGSLPEVYQPVFARIADYFPDFKEDPYIDYVDVLYSYGLYDLTGDGFPEMFATAQGCRNYTAYDGSVTLEYLPPEIRIFSWSEAEGKLYDPAEVFTIGAAPVGGFRGMMYASASGPLLYYNTWSSGTGSGTFKAYRLDPQQNRMVEELSFDYEYTQVNDSMVPFQYEGDVIPLDFEDPENLGSAAGGTAGGAEQAPSVEENAEPAPSVEENAEPAPAYDVNAEQPQAPIDSGDHPEPPPEYESYTDENGQIAH